MVTIGGSQSSRGEIYKALRFLTNESGYKNNPFLLIAFAATNCYKSDPPVFGYFKITDGNIIKAIKATNDNLYNNPAKNSFSAVTNLEAAAINHWASVLYDNVDSPSEARNRRWIDRFLSMSENERNSLNVGDVVYITNTEQDSIRASFKPEKRLQNVKQRFQETRDMWQKIDGIGQDQSFPLAGDHRQSEYLQNSQDTFEKEGWKINKQRTGKPRPKLGTKLVPNNYNPYSRANVGADAFMSVLYLFLEEHKFIKFNMRMRIVTDYLDEKRELEGQIEADNFHSVPPPPEIIKKYIKDFQSDGRTTSDPYQKVQVMKVISQLEELLEESNAFYKSRK